MREDINYYAHYNDSNGDVIGYYSDDNASVPTPNIVLTYSEWQTALANNYNKVVAGELVHVPEPVDEVALAAAERNWRNDELKFTDRFMLSDFPITTIEKSQVEVYRQQLRDYPNDSIPASTWVRPIRPTFVSSFE